MPDGQPNVSGMVNDPDFQKLAPADKRSALFKLTGDKSFSSLSDADTMQFVSKLTKSSAPFPGGPVPGAPGGVPPVVPRPPNPMLQQPTTNQNMALAMSGQQAQMSPDDRAQFEAGKIAGIQSGSAIASIPAAISAPLATAGTYALGYGGSELAGYGAKRAGLAPTGQGLARLGGGLVGGAIGGYGGASLEDALPSATRAGNTINQIIGKTKAAPVEALDSTAQASESMQLHDAGMTSPPPIRKFYNRMMNEDKPPLTVEEGRRFYIAASKQTAKTWSELAGPQKRQAALFTKALGQDISNAVEKSSPGSGQALQNALDEYHTANVIKSYAAKGIKYGGAAAGTSFLADLLARKVMQR